MRCVKVNFVMFTAKCHAPFTFHKKRHCNLNTFPFHVRYIVKFKRFRQLTSCESTTDVSTSITNNKLDCHMYIPCKLTCFFPNFQTSCQDLVFLGQGRSDTRSDSLIVKTVKVCHLIYKTQILCYKSNLSGRLCFKTNDKHGIKDMLEP